MNSNPLKVWCVVPAAGIGTRMQVERPKQYLSFRGATLLDATISRLLACDSIEKIIVCLNEKDDYWQHSSYSNHVRVETTTGGSERAGTVLSGIEKLTDNAGQADWVLVHDAARPCVRTVDVQLLINQAIEKQQGAILATPIHDTVKFVEDKRSLRTVARESLWRALTPQIFKLEELKTALLQAKELGLVVTDEASAIEHMNKAVHIVEGSPDNIKVTHPADIDLANFYINQQEGKRCE